MLKNSLENNTIEIFLDEENIPVKERICIRRSKLRARVLTGKTLVPIYCQTQPSELTGQSDKARLARILSNIVSHN
jgi:hypothetical protein